MAKKDQLRALRTGTVINTTSQKQETEVIKALTRVVGSLVKYQEGKIDLGQFRFMACEPPSGD